MNHLWFLFMNIDRTSHFWRTFGSWLPSTALFLLFSLCTWHDFTMYLVDLVQDHCLWFFFCSHEAVVEQWRLLVLWMLPVKKYLNLLWAWMGHGLSRCFPFSNNSFTDDFQSSLLYGPLLYAANIHSMYTCVCVHV